MKTYTSSLLASSVLQRLQRRGLPLLAAFMATLVSLPAHAITLPTTPLQTGGVFPAPDIFLILDDSGSMHDVLMPDDPGDTSPTNIGDLAYTLNSLSYNPATVYQPWIKADGTRYNTGLSYNSVWDDTDNLTSATDLTTGTETFYVPTMANPTPAQISATASYYRYQILPAGRVVQASWASSGTTGASYNVTAIPLTVLPATAQNTWVSGTTGTTAPATVFFTVPAGVTNLTVTIAGADVDADLYVRRSSAPTTSTGRCPGADTDSNEVCSMNNPTAGTYYVGVRAANTAGAGFSNVTLTAVYTVDEGCANPGAGVLGWRNCTLATPTGRTDAAEQANYAVWYSYWRTRIKMAKGGASEAFSQLGSNLRVGFNTIHNTNNLVIPVGTDGGLFRDLTTPSVTNNKTNWYNALQNTSAGGYTPLRSALQRAGNYYKDATATGPWGPETGSAQISCRQAFTILTTDGYWNANDDVAITAGDADSTAINTGTSANTVNNPTIYNTATPPVGTVTYAPVNPYKDNPSPAGTRSNTLADVAMYYWKNDLVQTLANDVPTTSGVDTAFWQHMVTFGISLGANGNLTPGAADLAQLTSGSKHWPNPLDDGNGGPDNIDDLWHAAVNGRGSFVVAQSPTQFVTALTNALASINARRGSASNVSTNSTSFQTNTRVFQALYRSGDWTGELSAYVATAAGVNANPSWNASQLIPAAGSRTIRTFVGGACSPTCGTTFPTAAQITALDQSARALSSVDGTNNAAYIAGTTTLEKRNGGTLRNRTIQINTGGVLSIAPTVLGDIVDSTPIYVPELQAIFVGANDGMLHAFDASNNAANYGKELFAYVPAGIDLNALKTLSDPQYGGIAAPHAYFVDGPIAVSSTAQTPAHNYLIGALGRGGKGLYGLDVHTPSAFTNANVLWETGTGSSDADMGQVLGEPVIVKLNNGVTGALVGNGINSTNGHAVLYVINIATGAVIKKLDTGAGTIGLSAPRAWDNDGNGTADYVYAGDLNGNLWKFDLRAALTASWNVAFSGSPLFVAKDASNNRQPITAGLALAKEPIVGRRWIFVGTGQFLTAADVTSTTVQSMYGIIDDDTAPVVGRTSSGDGDLQARSIIVTGTEAGKDVRGFEANDVLDSSKSGWYIDLVKPPTPTLEGERIVSNPRIFGIVLVTASLIPPRNFTCDAGGGGFINALDAFSGTSLAQPFFNVNGNVSGGQQVFTDDTLTIGGVTVPVGSVDLGLGMPTLPTMIDNLLIAGGSSGTIGNIAVNPQGPGARRVSWREIEKD